MKKNLLICFSFFLCIGMTNAQFMDDFESYNSGDMIAATSPDWETWGSPNGGADDAPISTEQAFSGYNSLKLESTVSTGGPADVVLKFGGVNTTGTLKYSMMMYVVGGTGAYFNFQAVEPVGTTWATDFFFDDDGTLRVNTGATEQLKTNYTQDEWFLVEFVANLDNNDWQVSIGGRCLGSYAAPTNSVASIDLFPYNPTGVSTYYVDDVSWSAEATVTPNVDVALSNLEVRTLGLTGQTSPVSGTFTNLGSDTITSLNVIYDDGNGPQTEMLTGLSVAAGEASDFTLPIEVTLEDGTKTLSVYLDNPNGTMDENQCNSGRETLLTGVTPAPNKKIVLEEATGTWCGWCPRGEVFLKKMIRDYPDHTIGIAVHGGSANEPMAIFDSLGARPYDAGLGSVGVTGYPSMVLDRAEVFDPSAVEGLMLNRLLTPVSAVVTNGAQWDATTRILDMSATVDFLETSGGQYKVMMTVTENGVVGDNASYNQANYYSGSQDLIDDFGTNWRDLPNPIPYTDMVYEEVARALFGGFGGEAGLIPTSQDAGDSFVFNYSWEIPADYNTDNMHIVAMILNPDGTIHNAEINTITEAIANGFTTSINTPKLSNELAQVFPNPTSGNANIELSLNDATNVFVEVTSMSGAKVATRDYGSMNGKVLLPFEGSSLANGMYIIHITLDDALITKKITLNR